MRYTVDRIEGEFAVVEVENTTVDMPVSLLPEGCGEGSVIEITLVDNSEHIKQLSNRLNNLFNKQEDEK